MTRRIFHQVFNTGVMPGPFHYIRARMVQGPPQSPYDDAGCRLVSSIHSVINMRAGLTMDRRPATPRPGDVLPPYRGVRKHAQDPTRLPA